MLISMLKYLRGPDGRDLDKFVQLAIEKLHLWGSQSFIHIISTYFFSNSYIDLYKNIY